ncbi:uncharacterized protein LOC127137329 [Lathyrus oleraceus]|uniref:uncharacterized protein LOC127137329 n=1 Tax=Pisum sativum TaxID=3888 RepID=UPI0021D382FE|nr:uncharacterized protein LOC127137329 [Pisum sativum]
MRCFTFQDFQLAPMFKELEHIVRIPMKNKLSFRGMEVSLKHEVKIVALHMDKNDVTSNFEAKANTKGFPLKFLIKRAYILLDAHIWEACCVVIALSIYGIILFPNLDNFIDMTAISILIMKNLMPTLLADMYYYLSLRHTKKGGMIAYCAPLLYKWEYDGIKIISNYGYFPNIPVIGTRDCINSNPILSISQLGYPMEGPPEEKSLEAFLLHDLGVGNSILFKRIKKAWENANKKGKADIGRKNCITKESYFQWIREMLKLIKISFSIEMPFPLPEPKPTHIPIEEAE